MNDLVHITTAEIVKFLTLNLPKISEQWWEQLVVNRLSFQQQRVVRERGYNRLEQLDLAALLRILDQNWFELSRILQLPREGRNWIKELQTVQNKWAHASNETPPASEEFRDADTVGRLLHMLDAEESSQTIVEQLKSTARLAMSTNATILEKKVSDGQLLASHSKEASNLTQIPLFSKGELVALRSDPKEIFPVIEVIKGIPENRYTVYDNRTKITYYESQLRATKLSNSDQNIHNIQTLHAHLTSLHLISPSTEFLFSLRSGRIDFVPYQYRPVLKLIRADRPRLLIADEVGVGKTIEAGLILKELRARMNIESVLVICPKALVAERKWYLEMKRFDESFTPLDGPLLRHCLKETQLEGLWPEKYSKAILPFSLFNSDLVFGGERYGRRNKQGLFALDPPPKFDLVIVDEAHHIRNSETILHHGIRYFCDNAQAVIFLTATPVQLGGNDLFTLLNVLRPDIVVDRNSFQKMSEPNIYINAAIRHCRKAKPDWFNQVNACLDKAATTEWGRLFLRESPEFQNIYDRVQENGLENKDRVEIIQVLENLYTFSGLINRTRRRDIGNFTTRKSETVKIDFTPDQKRLHNKLLNVVAHILERCHEQQNVKFMMTTIRRQTASCLHGLSPLLQDILSGKLSQLEEIAPGDTFDLSFLEKIREEIKEIIEFIRELDPYDPKVEKFIQVLQDKIALKNNKAIVFSTFRHTLAYLARHLNYEGIKYGLIHGDIEDEDRSEIRRRFALPKDDSNSLDVLLSSEVGCEGLDFQFCDFLINFDLPWNPMKIEQRIGRIDRYGQQSEAVAILNFITPGTVDNDIYERCLKRIGVFEHAIGGSEEILGTVTKEIRKIVERFNLTQEERAEQLQQLADNQIRLIKEEQTLEEKQSELFGLNVPKYSWEKDINEADNFWLSHSAIQRTVSNYLADRLKTDKEHIIGDQMLKTLRLNQEARNQLLEDYKILPRSIEPVAHEWEKWLKGGQPTLSVTFDQKMAAENPKSVHFSVTHPLVRQAASYFNINDPRYCSIAVENKDITAGDYPFAIYRWMIRGIKPDQILVPVCDDDVIESLLFSLLPKATDADISLVHPHTDFESLDIRHHGKWSVAKANHTEENRLLVEHRIQSLTISHRARCLAIEEQVARATNDKIRLMRQSELARANADFDRRIFDLQKTVTAAEIITSPVIFGILLVNGGVHQ